MCSLLWAWQQPVWVLPRPLAAWVLALAAPVCVLAPVWVLEHGLLAVLEHGLLALQPTREVEVAWVPPAGEMAPVVEQAWVLVARVNVAAAESAASGTELSEGQSAPPFGVRA